MRRIPVAPARRKSVENSKLRVVIRAFGYDGELRA